MEGAETKVELKMEAAFGMMEKRETPIS